MTLRVILTVAACVCASASPPLTSGGGGASAAAADVQGNCDGGSACGTPRTVQKGGPGVLLMQTMRHMAKGVAGAGAGSVGDADAAKAASSQTPAMGKVISKPSLTSAEPSTTTTTSRVASSKGAAKKTTTTAIPTTTTAFPEDGFGAGTGETSVLEELKWTQDMIASLYDQVASMTSCCGCNATEGGGGGGDKNGKWFRRPTTTRPNGPVSAGSRPTTTTLTTTKALGPLGLCAVFGDPHFITFDGGHTVLVGDMVIWLVKTRTVWIQALSKGSDGKFSGIAVGGSFMKGHTLIVYNNTKVGEIQTVFDGRLILNETVDEYHVPGIVDAHKDDEWDVQHHDDNILKMRTEVKFDVGDWHERFLGRPKGGLFLLKLPDGVEITATGVDFMSAVITMPRPARDISQGGYCGNFNGQPEDDAKPIVPSWNKPIGADLGPVEKSLDMFRGKHSPVALAAEAAGLESRRPRKPSGRDQSDGGLRPLLDAVASCREDLRREAAERCGRVEDARMQRDCIFDICLTKDVRAADGMLAAEVLEEEFNAKGVPVFMGHGLCADSRGRPYEAWETTLRTDGECQDVLRALALAKGVWGAQLRRTASCQIVVQKGTDPTGVMIPGGWGKQVAKGARGTGLVRGVARDGAEGGDHASWSCWQLV